RRDLGREVARQMARLHAGVPEDLGLAEVGTPPTHAGHAEVAELRRDYDEVAVIRIPIIDLAIAWLSAHADDVSGRIALVHADFRVGNLIVDPEDGTLTSVLDWETARFTDPVADIGWFFQRTSRGRSPLACKLILPEEFLDAY